MEDVLEVYCRPLDPLQPLVCMDERPTQLIQEIRQPLSAKPGKPQRFDNEYKRNGTANIFMLSEPLTGKRHTRVSEQRTAKDWALLMRELVDEIHPEAKKITLVMDNLNTHTAGSLYETFDPVTARRIANKLEIHHTPKHGSWLNMAEIELSVLSRQCLQRRIGDYQMLQREVNAWQIKRDSDITPIQWRFTTDDARIKLRHLYPKPAPETHVRSKGTDH